MTHLDIVFSNKNDSDDVLNSTGTDTLKMELDGILNGNRSSFALGEDVYIRVYSEQILNIKNATAGILTQYSLENTALDEAKITFKNTNKVSFSEEIEEFLSYAWVGNSLGNINYINYNFVSALSGLGVAFVTFTKKYQVLKLSNVFFTEVSAESFPVIVYVKESGNVGRGGFLEISFVNEKEADIYVRVRCEKICSNLPGENLQVFVDGSFKGNSDNEGYVEIGKMKKDSKHVFKLTGEGVQETNVEVTI